MSFTFTWEWNEVPLDLYVTEMEVKVQQARRRAAEDIAADAKTRVKVATGSLQQSIDVEDTDEHTSSINAGNISGGYLGSERRQAGAPIDYADAQEFNTKGNGQPFMTPASEAGVGVFQRRVMTAIEEVR